MRRKFSRLFYHFLVSTSQLQIRRHEEVFCLSSLSTVYMRKRDIFLNSVRLIEFVPVPLFRFLGGH